MVEDVWVLVDENNILLGEYGHFHSGNAAKFAYFEKTGRSGPDAYIQTVKLERVGAKELV